MAKEMGNGLEPKKRKLDLDRIMSGFMGPRAATK